MASKRLYSRYYCTKDTRHRVFPYDVFDQATEAPLEGKTGEKILLRTLNNHRNDDGSNPTKWAWCWACQEWVQCQRRTQHQVMSEYYARAGVSIRLGMTNLSSKINVQNTARQKGAK